MKAAEARLARSATDDGPAIVMPALSLAALCTLVAGAVGLGWLDGISLGIVLGGTIVAVVLSFPVSDISAAARLCPNLLLSRRLKPALAAGAFLRLAEAVRSRGARGFEGGTLLRRHAYCARALRLLEDGTAAEAMERLLADAALTRRLEIDAAIAILRRAGEAAPALGLVGTLIGLADMLARIEDPAAIGPGMALALLTTLYGAVLAHLVFHPLASRVERIAAEEARLMAIAGSASLALARGDSPRRIDLILSTHLNPAERDPSQA